MAILSTAGPVIEVNDFDGFWHYVESETTFESGDGAEFGFECLGDSNGPHDGGSYWYIRCDEAWTELDSGGDPGGGGPPEGFDAGTAMELFVAGFGIVFAFWALGKVPALIIEVLRR